MQKENNQNEHNIRLEKLQELVKTECSKIRMAEKAHEIGILQSVLVVSIKLNILAYT